jgi:hypothetical protein
MYPSPLAFFFPYWGFFAKRRASMPTEGPAAAATASALAGQFQRALEIDPMQAAALSRLWRQAPR